MKPLFVYPGSFCPPTYGHFSIVQKAAEVLPELTIVCSRNSEKENNWFSEVECAKMWQAYPLPSNVSVATFSSFAKEGNDLSRVVMIWGIRNSSDYDHEKSVMDLNFNQFNIDKYFFIMSAPELTQVSSTKARLATQDVDLTGLARLVAPLVVTKLLEKSLELKNLYLVVGPPGGGKSTVLKQLEKMGPHNRHLNTDLINKQLKPMVARYFAGADLYDVALERDEELTRFMGKQWLEILSQQLKEAPKGSNVFVEIPYGLKPGKELYRYIGGKVLFIGLNDKDELAKRNCKRGTPKLAAFIATIPDFDQSQEICRVNILDLSQIDTACELNALNRRIIDFNNQLNF